MLFAKERIQVICAQLKKQMMVKRHVFESWQVKEGFFLRPDDAQQAEGSWQTFTAGRDHWYGPDRHYWFRAEYTVPQELAGKPVWLVVHTQIEEWDDAKNPQFLLFVDGAPVQGLDMNHREVLLTDEAQAGRTFDLQLQAYTGTLHSEFQLIVQIAEGYPEICGLYYDLQMPLWAIERMDKENIDRMAIERILNDTINLLDFRSVYSQAYMDSVSAARAYIQQKLYTDYAGWDDIIATCIGHTHIDVAWWWTVEQTKEKTARSFATVLKLMDEYPEYKFMSSQPQLYVFLKERYPDLYERVKRRVAEGRWEPEGGMWLEADCNLTSGESLVRQFLHGKRFFKDEFGVDNRILWLPDVFGYSGALPQICKRSGIDYFMTTKLSWNQYNKIPFDTFKWRGIDGSEVLTHFISTQDVGQSTERFITTYNGTLHPDAILGGWRRYQQKEMDNDILVAFGHGDGGGGPTRAMLETGRRMEKGVRGIPKVRQAFVRQYFEELDARVRDDKRLATWVGEFYFEYHRGTYTSMARNKRSNRKSELMLMDLELLSVLAERQGVPYPAQEIDALWKKVLLNQFHDILPGSSIHEVYEVTRAEYAAVAEQGGALLAERLQVLAGEGDGVTVFNTLGNARADIVSLGDVQENWMADDQGNRYAVQQTEQGAIAYLTDLPSKGYRGFVPSAGEAEVSPFLIDGYTIQTPFYRASFDEDGRLAELVDLVNQRSVLREGAAGNQLRMYEDKPIYFDNWDIDVFYAEKFWDIGGVTQMRWIENGPVMAALRIDRAFSGSTMSQEIRFYARSRRIDFVSYVDWKENQHLLKVQFPLDLNTDEATFDIQFGNVTRKTHKNTSWEQARFESCAHKWMDVSEGGYGVSLLNDCKYGHSVDDGVMALTLIKSGIEPNPVTDQEEHWFTYSLLPHAGSWQDANTPAEAANLNQPCYAIKGCPASRGSFATVDKENVILETVKRAEDGEGTILRLYENRNRRSTVALTLSRQVQAAWLCDLMENRETELVQEGNTIRFAIKPYEIVTIRIL